MTFTLIGTHSLLQAISPFLTMISNYVSLVRQNVALCGNGLTNLGVKISELLLTDPLFNL